MIGFEIELKDDTNEVIVKFNQSITASQVMFLFEFLEKLGYEYLGSITRPNTFKFYKEKKSE